MRSTGSLGFVVINNADSEWSTTFMMGLPAGSYCNVVDGTSVAGVCTGAAYVGNPSADTKKETTNTSPVFLCSFTIGNDGSSAVTVGVRQAIAVHVGALGSGTSTPKIAQQVPVLFYENATTTYGDVGISSFSSSVRGRGWHACSSLFFFWPNRTFSSWEACRNLATGTRPTRCVSMRAM